MCILFPPNYENKEPSTISFAHFSFAVRKVDLGVSSIGTPQMVAGGDNMYTLMKPVGAGAMAAEFPLAADHPAPPHLPQPPTNEGGTSASE